MTRTHTQPNRSEGMAVIRWKMGVELDETHLSGGGPELCSPAEKDEEGMDVTDDHTAARTNDPCKFANGPFNII